MKNILRRIAVALVALCTISCAASAQTTEASRPYNLQKAYEVLQKDQDEEQALSLLKDQLKSTPDNAECWMLMCRIYRRQDKSGQALSCINEAIRVNKPKKSGLYTSTLYWWKSSVYDDMGEDEKEVEWLRKALDTARKDNRDNVQNISFDLGQALYDMKDYAASDAVYSQMVKEDETDQAAMTGLARNMIERGDYEGAVKMLDRSQKYGDDYSGTYKFRSEAYDKMGETDKAIDDALTWMDKDEDASVDAIAKTVLKHRSYGIARAKTMMKSSDNKTLFRVLLISVYEKSGEWENAIAGYDALEQDYGKDEYIYLHRADCYEELGLTDVALAETDKALGMSDDYYNNCQKGSILRTAGRYDEAIACFDKAIELQPSDAFAYYAKGWSCELSGDDDKALECYETGIDLDKSYPYIYLMRGEIFLKRGEIDKANADFETVVAKDTTAEDGSCRQYALHFLGRDEEADEWMQKIMDAEPYDAGYWYDRACLYDRQGRLDEAVKALEKALEMGYCSFAHMEHDDDMDAIRDREDYKALVAKYKEKLAERVAKMNVDYDLSREEKITEVPISRHAGGTFDVDCTVNGLALSMIFDTGASDVTISKVEADFMLKNKYLSKDDVKGRQYYQIANGDISEGTVITLKEVKIGDAVLHNVDASVVKNQKAPLLLGQSVLEKFGTFTVDNINSKLIIKQ